MRIPQICTHSSGQFRVNIRGKVYYLGTDRNEAERRYRELIAFDLSGSPALAGTSIKIRELVAKFIQHQQQCTSAKWWDKKEVLLRQATGPLILLYGDLPVSYFGVRAFHAVRAEFARVPDRSRRYVNSLANKIRQLFKWGVSQGDVPIDVYQKLSTVPCLMAGELGLKDNEEVEPVDWDRVRKTMDYMSGRNADLITILWETGMRPTELLSMKWDDIKDGLYCPRNHKTERFNKKRVIPLNKKVMRIIRKYRKSGLLFDWHDDSHSLYKAVQRACSAGKIKRWFPYQIRHATVTRITLQHGKDIAQAVAGHSSYITTAIYDHSQIEKVKLLK